jgi:hypothetical protein
MTSLIEVRITADGCRDVATGTDIAWPAPVALPAPVAVAGFGEVAAGVVPDGAAPLTVTAPPALANSPRLAIQVVLSWPTARTATLVGGPTPISLRMVADDPADVYVEATVTTATVTRVLRAAVPSASVDPLAIAVTCAGSDALLAVGADVVDRRPLPFGATLHAASSAEPLTIGGQPGEQGFAGSLYAFVAGDGVPPTLAAAALAAADDGLGEIDAFVDDHGAYTFGDAQGAEAHLGLLRWRDYANAVVTWSAATEAHQVRGPFLDLYRASGGTLGALGLPSAEEMSVTAYLDMVNRKRRTPGGGLRFKDIATRDWRDRHTAVDVDDVHESLKVARHSLTEAMRDTAWTESALVAAMPVAAEVREAPSVMVSAATIRAAMPAEAVSDKVLAALTAVNERRRDLRLLGQHGGVDGGVEWPMRIGGRHHRLDDPPVIDANVAAQAADLATAFVRSPQTDGVLARWTEAPDERIAVSEDRAILGEMLADGDRLDRPARLIDTNGVGWVLRGPRAQQFQRGVMIWSVDAGAVTLAGDVLVHWLRHGGTDGFLGVPLTSDAAVGAGRTATFAGGRIFTSPATGAHEVHGAILDRYQQAGGPTGGLGFPLSDEEDVAGVPGARRSSFEHGDIYWSAESGAHVIVGDIRERFLGNGGAERYGIPVTDEVRWANAGAEVRHTTFANGEVLAWVDGIGVFDHMVLDMASVRSGEIDDEVTSDDQPELYVKTRIWVDGQQVVDGRDPSSGYGATSFNLDGIAPVTVPLHTGATVRVYVEAWDEDTGPDDQFAAHDVTYSFENGLFGWLSAERGGHVDAPSTWDSGDAGDDTFKVSYTLAPPFDEQTHFDRFRQDMWWNWQNFSGPGSLGWQMFADLFEDVLDSSGSEVVDDVLHPGDRIFYATTYKSCAEKGNCMGMALTAANTYHRRTGLSQPLRLRQDTPDLRKMVNRAHGIQTGEASMIYKGLAKAIPGYLDPRAVFRRIQRSVGARIPILLNMRGKDGDEKVGHSTLAYRTDDSSWPWKIWIADPNYPAIGAWTDDNGSRFEIDADGAFRMYENGAKSSSYGAGAFNGTLGDSFIYDFPVAVLQGPHYTPDWLLLAGIAVAGAIMEVVGDVDVTQVGGGGYELFGDQRLRVKGRLGDVRVGLRDAIAAGLMRATDQPAAPPAEPVVHLSSYLAASAIAEQMTVVRGNGGADAMVERLHAIGGGLLEAARDSWTSALNDDAAGALASVETSIGAIDEHADISALLAVGERIFTPGAWPAMSVVEFEQSATSEVFVHQGPLPHDLWFELRGRGQPFRHVVSTAQAKAMVAATIANGATDTLRFDRLSSPRAGVRVETADAAKTVALSLSVAVDRASQRWVGWDTSVTATAGQAAGLGRADTSLGVVVTTAAPEEVVLSCAERTGSTVGARTRWRLVAQNVGEQISVAPADPASPFGAQDVLRHAPDGTLIERTVVDPTP